MNKHIHYHPIKLERIQQDIIKTRRQMNQLGNYMRNEISETII